ncbi:aminotransferase class III-fold pyridoxal phosphate-dependent enzyme [Algibacter aquimarinus]|uniref:Aminotransferase class III-fold pyridoxal phosphate-dependent enzyme n=1 Tax=Algibacter aquimarinus TaxID=1136748 RepID=A0ABP9H776_9FLAO
MNSKISSKTAEDILFKLYGITAKPIKLPGEVDFNFRIKVTNEDGFILKISGINQDISKLDFQQELLQYVELHKDNLIVPKVVKDKNEKTISEITDTNGKIRYVRLLTWVSGRLWSNVNPKLKDLRYSLGKTCGNTTKILLNFKHPKANYEFDWDIAQSLWTKNYLHLFSEEEKTIVTAFQKSFESCQKSYIKLRKSIIHNDANDNNIVVSGNLLNPEVKSVIDFGDAIYTQIINDLAVACAYAIMDFNDPLEASLAIIEGYHKSFALKKEELEHLYIAIAMRLVISVTKSAINKTKEPENKYLLISEKPAWELLKKWYTINSKFALYSFRNACGFNPHPLEKDYKNWTKDQDFNLSDLFPSVNSNKVHSLDLSVSSTWIGHEVEFNDLDFFQYKINKLQKEYPNKIISGGYLEPRPIYTSNAYDKIGNSGKESRTVHLGIDFWLPEQTPIHALFDGEIVIVTNDFGYKEYGGLIILKHSVNSLEFFTLYGHLSVDSVTKVNVGKKIKKGERIAELGNCIENGNWAPHLHFQVMLTLLDFKNDFPGVAYNNQIDVWKSICPDPNLLFKNSNLQPKKLVSKNSLIEYRKQHLGKSLSLSYKEPLKIVRGSGQYLVDETGRKYLDTINNVAHVGHEHPKVVDAGKKQMAILNTNSRYLHENISHFAKELISTLPPDLNAIHFVNSGSEANELAIRMAKAVTNEKDILASEVGYHGNTNICVDISSYKFDGKGGNGAPKHTHIFPLPDTFRGKYRGENAGDLYAQEVNEQIKNINKKGRNVAAFIIEPIISCGGQIELPKGFLQKAYLYTRKAGGICISDEIQTGCGRMGKTFWGFQLHNVIPDIVTIGKPLGNGHPLAAVACTQEVANKFANGMEYFNTFGGNPVSCAIGTQVLKTIKQEKLQENALKIGQFLKTELQKLSLESPIIGDVRGQGLFLGIELVDKDLNPLKDEASYIVNRMKDYGILMSTDGPDYNVIKIKPPMVFNIENVKELIFYLRKVLIEDFILNYKAK